MAGNRGQAVGGQVALDELQVGPAHGAGSNAQEQLARAGQRVGHVTQLKRRAAGDRRPARGCRAVTEAAGPFQDEGPHHVAFIGR